MALKCRTISLSIFHVLGGTDPRTLVIHLFGAGGGRSVAPLKAASRVVSASAITPEGVSSAIPASAKTGKKKV